MVNKFVIEEPKRMIKYPRILCFERVKGLEVTAKVYISYRPSNRVNISDSGSIKSQTLNTFVHLSYHRPASI